MATVLGAAWGLDKALRVGWERGSCLGLRQPPLRVVAVVRWAPGTPLMLTPPTLLTLPIRFTQATRPTLCTRRRRHYQLLCIISPLRMGESRK